MDLHSILVHTYAILGILLISLSSVLECYHSSHWASIWQYCECSGWSVCSGCYVLSNYYAASECKVGS
uniref:Putative secreted protein n=1 Tax=Panstrongylus lignarius TaxID=156445 RepID=A0A224XV34_9HEMI